MSSSRHAGAAPSVIASRNKLIAVASGKGGVGKTWFAITLAHAMANQGRRVLLFDGDLGLANVDIQLGLMPKRDLGSVLDGGITLKGALQTYEEGGFDILAGRSGNGSLVNISARRLAELVVELEKLATDYDQVVMDLGAGIERTIRLLAARAGMIVVLTNEEPTALTDAYAFLKVMRGEHPNADIRIVVNAASSPQDGERTYQTLAKASQSFLRHSPPLAGIIRRDRQVPNAVRAQTSLLIRSPNTEAAADVEAIARRLSLSG